MSEKPMNLRVLLTVVTGITFLFAVSTQDLRAASAGLPGPCEKLHALGTAELHHAVLASSAEAAAARKSVQDFLARTEVRDQVKRMGFEPAVVASRTALLSDSELLRLQAQIMTSDQQIRTAGIPGWAIALIVISAVLAVLVILAYALIDD
jgi:hypothetical protein